MNMKFLGLVFLIIYLTAAVGWCLNLYKLTQLDFASPYKAEVIYFFFRFLLPDDKASCQ